MSQLVSCACGCEEKLERLDAKGRERRFIYGHSNRGRKFPSLKHSKQLKRGHTPFNKSKSGLNGDTVFKKGHKTNLGRKFPPEFGKKVSKAQMGKRSSYRGEKHWNWKGGVDRGTDRNERTKFVKYFAPKVFARDNYTCRVCGQFSGYLHADHIQSWADYPGLRFDLDNCRTLCVACHYYVTFKRKMPVGSRWGLTRALDKKGG